MTAVHDGGQGAHGSRLAGALGAQRVELVGTGLLSMCMSGNVSPRASRSPHERRGHESDDGLPFVHDLLHERLAHALGDAAVDLALERHRVITVPTSSTIT